MTAVYLALYKGRRDGAWYRPGVAAARLSDWIIRTLTGSPYSHCELAVLVKPRSSLHPFGHTAPAVFDCYSSSIRDGGVRLKTMPLPPEKWDLIPVDVKPEQVYEALAATFGAKYDWLGATGVIARWQHDTQKKAPSAQNRRGGEKQKRLRGGVVTTVPRASFGSSNLRQPL